jgi:hypothetical protein
MEKRTTYVGGLSLLAALALAGCGQTPIAPTPVAAPSPSCSVTINNNGDGSVTVNGSAGCGNTTITAPSPSPSGAPVGDVDVVGFPIFCYGFGTLPGQVEPNHDACKLPIGYPEIAVTASPKGKGNVDLKNPGDQTDPKVIDWTFTVVPQLAASLVIDPANRFNARVVPASPRVGGAVFTLTATYFDPKGGRHDTTKSGSIE